MRSLRRVFRNVRVAHEHGARDGLRGSSMRRAGSNTLLCRAPSSPALTKVEDACAFRQVGRLRCPKLRSDALLLGLA